MIRGSRIGLRHVIEADLPVLIRAASDQFARGDFASTEMHAPRSVIKRFEEDGFSNDAFERLMICNEQGTAIGDVCHFSERHYADSREVGWGIFDAANRGQGYATEAASLLIDYLFQGKPVHRIACGVIPENIASRRVAEKCGFSHEGRSRGLLFVRGQYRDSDHFSILRTDWERRSGSEWGQMNPFTRSPP
jgi:RimJ/RimL family protein N-acetyltransferase